MSDRHHYYKPKKNSLTINAGNSIATLKSLIEAAGSTIHPGTTRIRIQNMDANDLYHSVGVSAAPSTTADMAPLPENQIYPYEYDSAGAAFIYVCGQAATHYIHVWQDGL